MSTAMTLPNSAPRSHAAAGPAGNQEDLLSPEAGWFVRRAALRARYACNTPAPDGSNLHVKRYANAIGVALFHAITLAPQAAHLAAPLTRMSRQGSASAWIKYSGSPQLPG